MALEDDESTLSLHAQHVGGFLSCLGGADTLFPFRKLPNKVDKKLLEEEIEEDDVSWV